MVTDKVQGRVPVLPLGYREELHGYYEGTWKRARIEYAGTGKSAIVTKRVQRRAP